jgi:hypothetical protein
MAEMQAGYLALTVKEFATRAGREGALQAAQRQGGGPAGKANGKARKDGVAERGGRAEQPGTAPAASTGSPSTTRSVLRWWRLNRSAVAFSWLAWSKSSLRMCSPSAGRVVGGPIGRPARA